MMIWAILPLAWFVVYLGTVVSIVVISVRKKYVRFFPAIVCSAGGRKEALQVYRAGSSVASLLLIATVFVWGRTINDREAAANPEFSTNGGPVVVWTMISLATGSAICLFFGAWFSIFEFPTLHQALFGAAIGLGFGFFSLMVVITKAAHEPKQMLINTRLVLVVIYGVTITAAFALLQYGESIKKKHVQERSKTDGDVNEVQAGEPEGASEDQGAVQPWDGWIKAAAWTEYVATLAFSCLVLTTVWDLV